MGVVAVDARWDVHQSASEQRVSEHRERCRGRATEIAYLCGNPDMVDATFEALREAGLPTPQVRREKYVSSK
jgi:NAD(P)H-flavin reductase